MKPPVRLTALAEADILQAYSWYEAKKDGLGLEFVERVEKAIHKIEDNPELYRPVIEDLRRISLGRFPYGLWYQVGDDHSIVIACLHHKRENPQLAMKRVRSLGPSLG